MELYDGLPLADVVVREVRISEEIAQHIEDRDQRYANAPGMPVIAVIEAAADQYQVIGKWPGSKTGEALALVGYSATAGRLVMCLIVPDEHPPSTGVWHLVTAWVAGRREARSYGKREGETDA